MNNFISDPKKMALSQIIVGDRKYSGSELLDAKNALAKALSDDVQKVDARVVLIGEGGFNWLVCYFALLELGMKIIPVDVELDQDVIETKIAQASPMYLVSLKQMDFPKKKYLLSDVVIQEIDFNIYLYKAVADVILHEDNAVMMIASSGTSGAEKLIMLSEANIQCVLNLYSDLLQTISFRSVLICLPISAIYPLAITIVSLNAGKKVVFCNPKQESVSQVMMREAIDIVPAVPLMLEMIHKAIFDKIETSALKKNLIRGLLHLLGFVRRTTGINLGPKILSAAHKPFGEKLQLFLSGGATLSVATLKDFYNLGFTIYEGYGLTEAAGLVTYRMDDYRAFGTVGHVADQIQMKISEDPENVGEILLKGDQLFSGYFNQKDVSSQAFSKGWFKTGDLGAMDAYGNLIVKGRIKDIIFLSDENGYPPEFIEENYKNIPGIKESIVVGLVRPETSGDHLILVAVKEDDTDESLVIQHIQQHMKKIPEKFHVKNTVFLPEIQKNKLGKICRNIIKFNMEEVPNVHL